MAFGQSWLIAMEHRVGEEHKKKLNTHWEQCTVLAEQKTSKTNTQHTEHMQSITKTPHKKARNKEIQQQNMC